MPINAPAEYFAAEKRYLEAKTREQKIEAMEEMIRFLPKHKGTHNLLAQLKKRLAKLRKEKTTKATAKPKFIIRKEGSGQVCIIGLTNSGKSSLLEALTDAKVEIADYPYTTKEPKVGMMDFDGVQIQLIEIPSTFSPDSISLMRTCDEILILLDGTENLHSQERKVGRILEENNISNKKITVVNKCDLTAIITDHLQISAKKKTGLEKLKEAIWSNLGLIRVFTKSPGKEKVYPPLTLPVGSTVRDATKEVHKDLLKNFNFARVFDNTKFSGQKVGLEYKLKDLDVVEIHSR